MGEKTIGTSLGVPLGFVRKKKRSKKELKGGYSVYAGNLEFRATLLYVLISEGDLSLSTPPSEDVNFLSTFGPYITSTDGRLNVCVCVSVAGCGAHKIPRTAARRSRENCLGNAAAGRHSRRVAAVNK